MVGFGNSHKIYDLFEVLPITYNQKINYFLDDIGYNQPIISLGELDAYKESGLADLLKQIKPFDVSGYANSDDLQFAKLDKFLKFKK